MGLGSGKPAAPLTCHGSLQTGVQQGERPAVSLQEPPATNAW